MTPEQYGYKIMFEKAKILKEQAKRNNIKEVNDYIKYVLYYIFYNEMKVTNEIARLTLIDMHTHLVDEVLKNLGD